MKSQILLLSLFLAAVGCGRRSTDDSLQKNVFGVDSRSLAPQDPLHAAAGALAGVCSGILVDRRIVLTAAHCVFDEFGDGLRPAYDRFTIAGVLPP